MTYAALFLVCFALSIVLTAALVVLLGDVVSYVRDPARGLPTVRRAGDLLADLTDRGRDALRARRGRGRGLPD
jgi:hypothetical protein